MPCVVPASSGRITSSSPTAAAAGMSSDRSSTSACDSCWGQLRLGLRARQVRLVDRHEHQRRRRLARPADPAGRVVRAAKLLLRRVEQPGREQRERFGPGQLGSRLQETLAEFGGRRPLLGIWPPGALEDRGERTEIGGHGHQLADAGRQRGDGRVGLERQRTGDRLVQRQPQRVDVGSAVERLTERLLGRRVPGDMGRHRVGLQPRRTRPAAAPGRNR